MCIILLGVTAFGGGPCIIGGLMKGGGGGPPLNIMRGSGKAADIVRK
jgi:hypothetical protein